MSVLIRGMEMPESCCCCTFFEELEDDSVCTVCHARKHNNSLDHVSIFKRADWCPLVEVPQHGRLIDADVLKKKWLEAESRMGADKVINLPLREYISNGCVYDLDNAPTIIEGET